MGSLRVISGLAKGVRLRTVPGDSTRPITDRVKESLFDIIGDEIIGASILDMFAGTGAVGIEALSRGADFAYFLEINNKALSIIRVNLESTHLQQKAEVIKTDAFHFIQCNAFRAFDFIFIAPPQYKDLWQKAMFSLDINPDWLAKNGQIIVQIDPKEQEDFIFNNFGLVDKRRYGDTLLLFYEISN